MESADNRQLVPRFVKANSNKICMYNVRESRLEYMYHRNLITTSQYEGGNRFRRICELSQLGGKAASYEPRIDSSYRNVMNSKIGAIQELNYIREDVGKRNFITLQWFCYMNFGITEISRLAEISERKASNRVHEALLSVAIFYGYISKGNTIRGQGKKKRKI